jgi:hypothetical protein
MTCAHVHNLIKDIFHYKNNNFSYFTYLIQAAAMLLVSIALQ